MEPPDVDALVDLLVRGTTSGSYTGTYVRRRDDGSVTRLRIQRRGRLARFEEGGRTVLVAGHDAYLRHWPVDPEPVRLPRDHEVDDFEMSLLTIPRPDRHFSRWLRADAEQVLETLSEISREGRRAWRFAAPEVQGHRPTVVVDARLGLVLEIGTDDLGVVEAWHDVDEHEHDDAVFSTHPGREDQPGRPGVG